MRPTIKNQNIESAIRGEIFSVERLEEYAVFLAAQLSVGGRPKIPQTLLPRMRENGVALLDSYRTLTRAIHRREIISPAGEWLTDNFHIVEEQLREIQIDLPPAFYKELPKISLGELAGYPRIYAIALALVAHTDSQLEPETIRRFIQAYQSISPLKIGELWALAITLRLVLVENLRRIVIQVVSDHEKRNQANQFVDQIFGAIADQNRFKNLLLGLPAFCSNPMYIESAFVAQVAKRLRDQEPELWPALESLEKFLSGKNTTAEQVVQLSHQTQAANQVTVANIITSMRLISSLDWRDFFESVSLVDRVLEKDPVYPEMDFLTRDRYRHVIEKVSKRTGISEIDLAELVISIADEAQRENPMDERQSHVGFYLIGRGVKVLEKRIACKAGSRILNSIFSHANAIYFGLLTFLLALVCYTPIYYSIRHGATSLGLIGIAFLILIPASELALNLLNFLLTHMIHPRNLPKLELSSGIPERARTMVVIPCMLFDGKVTQGLIEKLEIHYLGNSDPQLFFALLTDFTDANEEFLSGDELSLGLAIDGIKRLNTKYAPGGADRFFLFHRRRLWNPSENVWMGWERKRGKIHEFNRLLRGDRSTSFIKVTAPFSLLPSISNIITLDADTYLPRDSARKMVGTILHPLNQPRFDEKKGRIVEGYGILQPRIGISIESSSRSFFSKIFSGYTGIDPYTTAVSDVYQDLFHEGSYTGKGLYVVDEFEKALQHRVPENTVLSHDLFEGLYARAALLTDVELIDDFPQSYHTFFTRQHRWTRGDWQIGGWIFGKNQLSLISRWKIVDNLRRSLVAPFTFLWFILAWVLFPGDILFWVAYAVLIITLPSILQLVIGGMKQTLWTRVKPQVIGLQIFLYLIFLAHQAFVQTDAIARVFYRKLISKKRLLEWATAAQVENRNALAVRPLWQTYWPLEIILLAIALFFIVTQIPNGYFSLILILPWMASPFFARVISLRTVRKKILLDSDGQYLIRQIARRTWNYFESYVDAEQNWLPPDNHQELPESVTANRTSPTNIGLYIVSLVSARDFGYISHSKFVSSLGLTLASMKKLELYEGHFLNWYDTKNLNALNPKYVSTVDSGNLAGYLLVGSRTCLEISDSCAVDGKVMDGLKDTFSVIEHEIGKMKALPQTTFAEIFNFQQLLVVPPNNVFSDWMTVLSVLQVGLEQLKNHFLQLNKIGIKEDFSSVFSWMDSMSLVLRSVQSEIEILLPSTPNIPFSALALYYSESIEKPGHKRAKNYVTQILNDVVAAALFMDQSFRAMNFDFLLDHEREVFSIGYSVSDRKFDSGLYDLLGSESRLASFVAIAKGDVPQEHWFRLGRQLVPISSGRALVSWSASMFEYLMPLLVMRDYDNTLLDETAHAVVLRQISYGLEHHVPWGISEAGYNARDLQLNYQYGPFGIPGMGLKRGLSHDLVISPYSTFLAAMVNPVAALENVKRLIHQQLLTDFGFYESVDYTTERLPPGEKFAIIKSFMAHHQGMSLVAMNNVIHQNIIQNRFHDDPRVCATRLLLQERVPQGVVPILPKAAEIELEGPHPATTKSMIRQYNNAGGASPRVQLLSNGNYSLMISTAGGGYSKCNGLAVSRWKEDATRDHWGNFIFIKDDVQKNLWSTTFQPFAGIVHSYQVIFGEDKVEFRRRDEEISTHTQILVAPEDNVEIRHVTLTNHSDEARVLELTSYLEPVLGPSANDSDHPAFSKLFIQTEFLPSKNALLAKRRKRSAHDQENWGLHVVVSDAEMVSHVEYETDRAKFIGRGHTLKNASALFDDEGPSDDVLSNTVGSTLDPIFSLRIKVRVPANGQAQVAFTTGLASSHEEALELADRYHDIHSFERESKLAWTKSQVDMRHLNIDSDTAHLFQHVAERILYSESSLRPPSYQRAVNTDTQSSLWASGISGDLPIVVVRIADQKDIATIRKLLRCHEYLRLRGLIYDFIILNEDKTTYFQGLQEELQQQIRSTGSQSWLNKSGGVFILRSDLTPGPVIANIHSVARISLSADEPLKEQINRKVIEEKYPPLLVFSTEASADDQPQTPIVDLDFFNGTGGFSKDGREYVIALSAGQWTPAPWINVVGNTIGFGFQVSESGAGFTWFVNSQTNRLTPWSNDPVSDPPGEIIYLRDDDTGEIWTPTPLPIRSESPYIIRHGQGYTVFEHTDHGIQHSLTLFIPKDNSVKISLLKIKNLTNRTRKISLTSYTEWVLGSQREKTAPYLVCDVDQECGAIFARNPHDNEFSSKVSFADLNANIRTFTCSRKEFLGRNGNYAAPKALSRDGLSKKRGTGQDPCAVLQTSFELKAGEELEISVLLGQCESAELARELVLFYRDLQVVKAALSEVVNGWNHLINTIQVKTPDPAMNILMNRWLLYQTLSCRYWSRTAFYQSGGAYGFRDQLQDCMAFVYSAPKLTREHILRASERQFKEGDVQHWWHPPTGRGIRTRMSDDLLWLPYVVSFYIHVTGDRSILSEQVSFLEAPLLKPEQEDSYSLPGVSQESASVFDHCIRALDHSLSLGSHDLPYIGTGDWNDGMNRVGAEGNGESVWLGWFLYKVLEDFIPLCEQPAQTSIREKYQSHQKKLKDSLEKNGWDGEWYRRAYFDDGTPLGSAANQECKIDSISQSWAVLSGAGDQARSEQAMAKVSEYLVRMKSQLILLLTPPFDQTSKDPGYIKGYVPGVRENGGQYTHAAVWTVMAFAELGKGNRAFELFSLLNPIHHSKNEAESNLYKTEPYAVAADVYAGNAHEGRGGWSWYTGSSSWYYRAGLESILGFQLRGSKLKISPCIPSDWKSYQIMYTYGKTKYFITVENPDGLNRGDAEEIDLLDDGTNHEVVITMRSKI